MQIPTATYLINFTTMKTKAPLTATELRMRLEQDIRRELFKWLIDGDILGKEIDVRIDHFYGGGLGKLICRVERWEPPLTPEP